MKITPLGEGSPMDVAPPDQSLSIFHIMFSKPNLSSIGTYIYHKYQKPVPLPSSIVIKFIINRIFVLYSLLVWIFSILLVFAFDNFKGACCCCNSTDPSPHCREPYISKHFEAFQTALLENGLHYRLFI